MKHVAFYIYILLSAFLVTSCSLGEVKDPLVVVDIEDQIELNLFQDLTEYGSYLWSISTLNDDICANSFLLTNLQIKADRQNLIIDGLEIPTDCADRNSKIFAEEKFAFTGVDLSVDVHLGNNLISQLYIAQNEGAMTLINNDIDGLILENTTLQFIKPNYLWGGIFSTEQSKVEAFNQLVNKILSQHGHETIAGGHYGYFNNIEDIQTFDLSSKRWSNKAFTTYITEEMDILSSNIPTLISIFRSENPEIDFYMMSGKGQRF